MYCKEVSSELPGYSFTEELNDAIHEIATKAYRLVLARVVINYTFDDTVENRRPTKTIKLCVEPMTERPNYLARIEYKNEIPGMNKRLITAESTYHFIDKPKEITQLLLEGNIYAVMNGYDEIDIISRLVRSFNYYILWNFTIDIRKTKRDEDGKIINEFTITLTTPLEGGR